MPTANEETGNAEHRRLQPGPERQHSHPRARIIISYYAEHHSAEMATVLRNNANILTRLREKMRVHLCTVFHSARNSSILIRNAMKLRMLQEPSKNPQLSFALLPSDLKRTIQNAIEIRGSAQVV